MSDFTWEQIVHTGLSEIPEIGKLQIRNAVRPMNLNFFCFFPDASGYG